MMKSSTADHRRVTGRPARPGEAVAAEDASGPPAESRGRLSRGRLAIMVATGLVIGSVIVFVGGFHNQSSRSEQPTAVPIPTRYDPDRAFRLLVELCDLGPRPSGSAAMQRQQQILSAAFKRNGGAVSLQTFDIRHPEDGSPVTMANLIASWYPDRPKRFLICAHYDTRPYPDQDPRNPKGVFVGANDGASGAAALVELSYQLHDLPADVGVDLVLFDGEEFIWQQGRDQYFLGSTFFAEKYKSSPPSVPYRAGILMDMIGDRELKIYFERNSLRFARQLANDIWQTADRLGVQAFIARSRHEIQDDHLPLNRIAGIPTVDLIDFDYPRPGIGAPSYWHTERDVPENCSGQSIAAVVWVVDQWLKQQ